MDDLFFNQDHIMIQDMVREFAESEIMPIARELDEEEKFPTELVKQMGELGLMGINVPEKYGADCPRGVNRWLGSNCAKEPYRG